MTQAFDPAGKQAAGEKWGWFVALGVLMIMGGGIAFGNVLAATVASVYTVGIVMLAGGLLHLAHASLVSGLELVAYWSMSGACFTAACIFAFLNPLLASAILTLLMAVALMVAGAFRIWSALNLRPLKGWGWIALGGVVTALAGLVIAARWPVDSLWILGLFLAADLIVQGSTMIAFSLGIRSRN